MLKHANSHPVKARRVLLLGARGFVAPALAEGLARDGVRVLAVGSSAVDLCDPASAGRISSLIEAGDVVVMAAALTPEKGRDAGTLVRNLRMAEHVASALQGREAAHVVYFSSDAVYEAQSGPISESTPAAPADLYGLMHRAREVALREAADRAGIPFCALRPCAIYGPGDTHNSYGPNRFIRSSLKEGKIQIFGLGEETRDHVYIADVVSLAKAAISHRSSGVLNLVSAESVSFGDLARRVVGLTGGRSTIESLPRKAPVTHRVFDAAGLRASFPGHVATSLDEGLRGTVAAFAAGA